MSGPGHSKNIRCVQRRVISQNPPGTTLVARSSRDEPARSLPQRRARSFSVRCQTSVGRTSCPYTGRTRTLGRMKHYWQAPAQLPSGRRGTAGDGGAVRSGTTLGQVRAEEGKYGELPRDGDGAVRLGTTLGRVRGNYPRAGAWVRGELPSGGCAAGGCRVRCVRGGAVGNYPRAGACSRAGACGVRFHQLCV
jgi:hypothetical protein